MGTTCGSLRRGYTSAMTDPRLADHEMGLELQIVELVEQRERATVQGRRDDAEAIQREIDGLQLEMARTAEALARGYTVENLQQA